VPQNILRYIRDDAYAIVVITGFDCIAIRYLEFLQHRVCLLVLWNVMTCLVVTGYKLCGYCRLHNLSWRQRQ